MSRAQKRDVVVDVVVRLLKEHDPLEAAKIVNGFDEDQVTELISSLAMQPSGTLRPFFDLLKTSTYSRLAWTLSGRQVSDELRTGFIRAAQHHAYPDHVDLGTFMLAQLRACRTMQVRSAEESRKRESHMLRWLDAWLPLHGAYEGLWDVVTSHFLCETAKICAFYDPVEDLKIVFCIFNAALKYATRLSAETAEQQHVHNEIYRLASCGLFLCGKKQDETLFEPTVRLLPQRMSPSIIVLAKMYGKGKGNQRLAEFAMSYCQGLYAGHVTFLRSRDPTILQWRKWRNENGLGTDEIDDELWEVVSPREGGMSHFER